MLYWDGGESGEPIIKPPQIEIKPSVEESLKEPLEIFTVLR